MDAVAIFALIEKGLALVPILINAGEDVVAIVGRLRTLAQNAQTGTVSDEDMDALEADLDAAIAKFNDPMPPAA